jgi:predicted RNA-binding Zn-ribbon protein involved in translation (DUF1610 family)
LAGDDLAGAQIGVAPSGTEHALSVCRQNETSANDGDQARACVPVARRKCGILGIMHADDEIKRCSAVSDAHVIKFQCPNCGHELEQTIASLKLGNHMRCQSCDIGINIDTNRLANAAEEMQSALEKVPPEITIKFFR